MAKAPLGHRRVAVCAWLTANGINPSDVSTDADISIHDSPNGRFLRCEVYDRTPDGHLQADEHGKNVATVFVNVPLQVEPPDWWREHVKPTRDQLLATVDRLRQLADVDPGLTGENIDGWNQAMDAVKDVLDGKSPV